MSYTVWTKWPRSTSPGNRRPTIVLTEIPSQQLAERLRSNLAELYGDADAWIEQN